MQFFILEYLKFPLKLSGETTFSDETFSGALGYNFTPDSPPSGPIIIDQLFLSHLSMLFDYVSSIYKYFNIEKFLYLEYRYEFVL